MKENIVCVFNTSMNLFREITQRSLDLSILTSGSQGAWGSCIIDML